MLSASDCLSTSISPPSRPRGLPSDARAHSIRETPGTSLAGATPGSPLPDAGGMLVLLSLTEPHTLTRDGSLPLVQEFEVLLPYPDAHAR